MTTNSLVLTDSQILNSAQDLVAQDGRLINSAAIQFLIQESLTEGKATLPTQLSQPDFQPVLEAVLKEFAEGRSTFEELILPVGLENGDLSALYLRKDNNGKPQVIYIDPTGLDIAPDSFDDTFTKGNALRHSTIPACVTNAVNNGLGVSPQDIVITTNKVRKSVYQDGIRYVDTKTDDSAAFTVHIVGEIANGRYDVKIDETGKGDIVCKSADGSSVTIDSLKLNAENLRQGQLGRLKQDFRERFPDRADEIDSIKVEKPAISEDKKPKLRKAEKTSDQESNVKIANPLSFAGLLKRGAATIFALANLPAAQGGIGDKAVIGTTTNHDQIQNFPQPPITPTVIPTELPTLRPTAPTGQPTIQPSSQPSSQPSMAPTSPTGQPTRQPTRQPTSKPSLRPTGQPTSQPTVMPSVSGPISNDNKRKFIETIIYGAGGVFIGAATETAALTFTEGSFGGLLYRLWEDGALQGIVGSLAVPAVSTGVGAIAGATVEKPEEHNQDNSEQTSFPTLHPTPQPTGNFTDQNTTNANVSAHANYLRGQEENFISSNSVVLDLEEVDQQTEENQPNIRAEGVHARVDDDQIQYDGTKSVPHGAENPKNPTYVAEGALNGAVAGAAFVAGICLTGLIATCCCSKNKDKKTHPVNSNSPYSDIGLVATRVYNATGHHL